MGSWLPGFGGSSSDRYLDPLVSRGGTLRNLGVLPSNSLGRKEGRRKGERAGPRHSCSDGSPENRLFLLPPWQPKSEREGPSGRSPWRVSNHPHLCPPQGIQP